MSSIGNESEKGRAVGLSNEEEASLWRWFCLFYEEGRIRWMRSAHGWLVSVEHMHLSTEKDFDTAIRTARDRFYSGSRYKAN